MRRLMTRARQRVRLRRASIFVNPLQFDRQDDLARYPRTLDADLAVCATAIGVDIVFAPSAAEMYPSPPRAPSRSTAHRRPSLRTLPARALPGVATVVLKLLADRRSRTTAYFGEKDAQQLAIVRRLVSDFNLPVRIAGVPTVREADGLALSSRNARLDATERGASPSRCTGAAMTRAGDRRRA